MKTNEIIGESPKVFVPPHILAMNQNSDDPTQDVPDSSSRRQIFGKDSPC